MYIEIVIRIAVASFCIRREGAYIYIYSIYISKVGPTAVAKLL
jgi:hypothetical protein